MPWTTSELWSFLPLGYLLTIAIELPILLGGLSPRHDWRRRCFAGAWLTACTYPIVAIVLPLTVWPMFGYVAYVVVAEIFAPVAECLLFRWAFHRDQEITPNDKVRDMTAIVAANVLSFLLGGWLVDRWWG
jgi:hypothetical protein